MPSQQHHSSMSDRRGHSTRDVTDSGGRRVQTTRSSSRLREREASTASSSRRLDSRSKKSVHPVDETRRRNRSPNEPRRSSTVQQQQQRRPSSSRPLDTHASSNSKPRSRSTHRDAISTGRHLRDSAASAGANNGDNASGDARRSSHAGRRPLSRGSSSRRVHSPAPTPDAQRRALSRGSHSSRRPSSPAPAVSHRQSSSSHGEVSRRQSSSSHAKVPRRQSMSSHAEVKERGSSRDKGDHNEVKSQGSYFYDDGTELVLIPADIKGRGSSRGRDDHNGREAGGTTGSSNRRTPISAAAAQVDRILAKAQKESKSQKPKKIQNQKQAKDGPLKNIGQVNKWMRSRSRDRPTLKKSMSSKSVSTLTTKGSSLGSSNSGPGGLASLGSPATISSSRSHAPPPPPHAPPNSMHRRSKSVSNPLEEQQAVSNPTAPQHSNPSTPKRVAALESPPGKINAHPPPVYSKRHTYGEVPQSSTNSIGAPRRQPPPPPPRRGGPNQRGAQPRRSTLNDGSSPPPALNNRSNSMTMGNDNISRPTTPTNNQTVPMNNQIMNNQMGYPMGPMHTPMSNPMGPMPTPMSNPVAPAPYFMNNPVGQGSVFPMNNCVAPQSFPMSNGPIAPASAPIPMSITATKDDSDAKSTTAKKSVKDIKRKTHPVTKMAYTDPFGDYGLYTGDVDDESRPHGKGKMKYDNGIFYEGSWTHGQKEDTQLGKGDTMSTMGGAVMNGTGGPQQASATRERIMSGFTSWKGQKKKDSDGNKGKSQFVYGLEWVDMRGQAGKYTGNVTDDDVPHGTGVMRYDFGLVAEGDWRKGVLNDGGAMNAMNSGAMGGGMTVAPGGGMSVAPGMSVAGGGMSVVSGMGMMSVGGGMLGGMGRCLPPTASVAGGGYGNGMMNQGMNPYYNMNPAAAPMAAPMMSGAASYYNPGGMTGGAPIHPYAGMMNQAPQQGGGGFQ